MSFDAKDPKLSILNIATLCGIETLKRISHSEVQARCPFCGDSKNPRHGHLNLNTRSDAYRCTKCGTGGFAVGLYARLTGISNKEAYQEIMKSQRVAIDFKQPEVKQHFIADIGCRDTVYRSLLDKLTLTQAHRYDLNSRGLSDLDIKEYKSISVTADEKFDIAQAMQKEGMSLKGIPGFYVDEERGEWTFIGSNCFLIPVLNLYGKIQGFQTRFDHSPDGRKYRWFSSVDLNEGTGARSWISVNWNSIRDTKKVCITEGPLKGHVASRLSDTTFISIPGTGVYKQVPTLLNQMKGVQKVPISFDMDKSTNKYVMAHLQSLMKLLKSTGYDIDIVDWDPRFKGIDDYLLHLYKKKQTKKRAG